MCAAQPLKLGHAPPSEAGDETRQFDFWIGEWDVTQKHRLPSGQWFADPRSRLEVYPVLSGDAIVEHFRGPVGSPDGRELYGYSLRAFDPAKEKWVALLLWPSPQAGGGFGTLEGVFHHNRCEIFTEWTNPEGETRLVRYTFSDSIDGYYRWNDDTSTDGGETWASRFIMEGVRRDPERDGPIDRRWLHVRDKPRMELDPRQRALDFLEGAWSGVAIAGASAEQTALRVETEMLMQGAAVQLRYFRTRDDGTVHEVYAIHAWDSRAQKLVAYTLNDSRRLRRFESDGPHENGAVLFVEVRDDEDGDTREIERYQLVPRGGAGFAMKIEHSHDAGASWDPVLEAELQPEP